MPALQCQPFQSGVEPSFWSAFSKLKLEKLKLDVRALRITGRYGASRHQDLPPTLRVSGESFNSASEQDAPSLTECQTSGELINVNTKEDFKHLDKKARLNLVGQRIMEDIRSGAVEEDPQKLIPFFVISYADLKFHKYLYWFCFPAAADPRFVGETPCTVSSLGFAETAWDTMYNSAKPVPPFFGVTKAGRILTLKDLYQGRSNLGEELSCFGMVDPGTLENNAGWPLLNFSQWILERYFDSHDKGVFSVLCLRRDRNSSLGLRVTFSKTSGGQSLGEAVWIGWESFKGKMTPRVTDLSAQLNPEKLAHAACDLNVKLMRWRALPELNTDLLSGTSCLLIGSGTLGCAAARCLLGWGFRTITMLDNGHVSYSNPVRQSLFEFEDCKDGGRPKAVAAADALRRILPGVNVRGVNLSIPMPGHFVTTDAAKKETEKQVHTLEEEIQAHDVVMLLTDTRESRWLPTMLGAKYDKIVLDAALGFDSYMVMRHGSGPNCGNAEARLGCYFCNDVVAPQNSLRDRTLDQQCTVTRPGLAPIAGALIVELLVALLHSSKGNQTGTTQESVQEHGVEKLGPIPHQIRGSLYGFSGMNVSGQAFPQCTACSSKVVDAYGAEGFSMLCRVFNEPNYLEDLTGLTEMRSSAAIEELLADDVDAFDDEDDF